MTWLELLNRSLGEPIHTINKDRKTKSGIYSLPLTMFSDLVPNDIEIGYETNPYVYGAIEATASSASRVDWVVKDKMGNIIPRTHPDEEARKIYALIERPNEINTTSTMISYIVKDLAAKGVTSWEIARNTKKEISALYRLYPNQLDIVTDPKKYIDHFEYGPDKIKLDVNEVLYIRLVSPRASEELTGFSPLQAVAKAIKLSEYENLFEIAYFKNAGTPSMILSVKYPLDEEQYQKLEQKIAAKTSGVENAFKLLIIDGNDFSKVELSSSLKDIPITDLNNVLRQKILAGFRVPENVIGLSMQSTKASASTVVVQYWQSVIIPLLKLIKEALNTQVISQMSDKYEIDFDLSPITELQTYKADISEKVSRLYLDGIISRNEARKMIGLPPLPKDQFIMPVNEVLENASNKNK